MGDDVYLLQYDYDPGWKRFRKRDYDDNGVGSGDGDTAVVAVNLDDADPDIGHGAKQSSSDDSEFEPESGLRIYIHTNNKYSLGEKKDTRPVIH